MKKNNVVCDCENCNHKVIIKKHHGGGGDSGMIYFLGVVGALFYFLQGAGTFETVIMGIGKAFVWPALLMFKLLTFLQL